MQVLQHDQLINIKKSDLPKWVSEEVFPIFDQVMRPEMQVRIGVSTGVDSMVLASLLLIWCQQNTFPQQQIHILHCNHKLRMQSENEVAYVQEFFAGLHVQIFERSDMIAQTENDLREWRYRCFSVDLMDEVPLEQCVLFLGHHLEDRIESTFLNCIRGATLQGFKTMQILQDCHPLFPGKICRPLLGIKKEEIIAFCEQFGIRYFEDETNADLLTSQRNFLRQEIIGKLKEMHDGKSRFLESMKQVYTELDKWYEKSDYGSEEIFYEIPTFPARNMEYAYRIGGDHYDIVRIWKRLRIAKNLRDSQIQEWKKWTKETKSGWKAFQGWYFFFHEQQLFVMKPFTELDGKQRVFWTEYVEVEQTITKL
jgi:tRNA(Ile)-lysidine synthetase-like protein